MRQRVVQGNSLRRIQRKHLVQQILQLAHFTNLVVRQILAGNQLLLQVPVRFDHRHDDDFFLRRGRHNQLICSEILEEEKIRDPHPLRNLVDLVRQEVAVLIEMLILKLAFPYDLVRYLAL